jgi:hypothetical protein
MKRSALWRSVSAHLSQIRRSGIWERIASYVTEGIERAKGAEEDA